MKQKILVVYRSEQPLDEMRYAIRKHLQTLEYLSREFEITYYNAATDIPSLQYAVPHIELDYPVPSLFSHSSYYAILFHTTFLGWRWTKFGFFEIKKRLEWLGKSNAIKIALPQDEYDHASLLDEWIFDWKIDGVMTVCGLENVPTLYPLSSKYSKFKECLTGYIDSDCTHKKLLAEICHIQRPFDIVYRSQKVPYWFGSHGQEKYLIAEIISAAADRFDLRYNISTNIQDTILGSKWLNFLQSGRCTIGTESGSSVIDYRGEKQAQIQLMLLKEPMLSFEDINRKMPQGWDQKPITALSPRHLEAISTKTCQILLEGKYNNILVPGKHYIPLKRGYTNLDDVMEAIKDPDYTQSISDCAYQEIITEGKYTYADFANEIIKFIKELENSKIEEDQGLMEQNTIYVKDSSNRIICSERESMLNDELVEILQREIISLKHENARLYANLQEAQYSGIKGTFRFVMNLAQQVLRKKF